MPKVIIVTGGFRLWFLMVMNFKGFTTFWNTIWLCPMLTQSEQAVVIAHEKTHIRQIKELGILAFTWQYTVELIKNVIKYKSLHSAYLNISFEVEARRNAGQQI